MINRDALPAPGNMTPFHRALAHTLAAEGWYTDSGPTYRKES